MSASINLLRINHLIVFRNTLIKTFFKLIFEISFECS